MAAAQNEFSFYQPPPRYHAPSLRLRLRILSTSHIFAVMAEIHDQFDTILILDFGSQVSPLALMDLYNA